MLARDSSWLVEEPELDEPADLLTIPEIRHHIAHEPHEDQLGLRALLETPEAPPSPWWREDRSRDRRKHRRNHSGLATAA
jgi:hypothetical protein